MWYCLEVLGTVPLLVCGGLYMAGVAEGKILLGLLELFIACCRSDTRKLSLHGRLSVRKIVSGRINSFKTKRDC